MLLIKTLQAMLKLWPNEKQTAIWIRLWLQLTNGTIAKQIFLAALNTNFILSMNQLGLSCLPIYHTGPYWNVWKVVSCDFMVTSLVVYSCSELFLWFTATPEQITCSELGAYLGLSINVVLVCLITHLSWTVCYDTVGGLYKIFLHPSFFQSNLFMLYYFLR